MTDPTIEDEFDALEKLMNVKRGGVASNALLLNKIKDIRNAEATFKTINADTGSAEAATSEDSLTISGGDNVSTSISGTTLTIDIGYFMEYKGTHDASTAIYPTSPEKGDVWVVSVAGTISGTYYAVGDWMVYNGTSWDRIEASNVVSDTAYNATSWNAVTTIAPSKNAVRDLIESLALNTLPLAASGAIDCNAQAITNVGNVDGVDVSVLATAVSGISITNMPTVVNNWKMYCTNGSGIMTEIATGAAGTVLSGNGVAAAPSFQSAAATGWTVVTDIANLQTALDNGGIILLKAGTYNLTATLDIDQNKSVILLGEGDETIIDCNGDRSAFNITAADNVVLSNFKIDANDLSTTTKEIINITEGSDNPILIDNVRITGDGSNGYGIEINSDNCRISHCYIDNVNIGIMSNNDLIIIDNNHCISNLIGMSIVGTNTSINNNICSDNTLYGIYINGGSNSTFTGNICYANNTNFGGAGGGIYIAGSSTDNVIVSNSSIANTNAGAGTGYGINIANASSNNNIIKNNRLQGNDIAADDVGGNNRWEFDAFSRAEIEDITTNFSGSCIIKLPNGTIDLGGNTITVSGGGSYIIQGQGNSTIIDIGGDATAFNITSATNCVLQYFKIDAIDLTTVLQPIIILNEGSDHHILIDTITIVGDDTCGYGIQIISDNCEVINCYISDVKHGIRIEGNHNIVQGNLILSNQSRSISCYSDYNIISNNQCYTNGEYGIYLNGADNCIVSNNICYNNTLFGILLTGSDNNTINGNICNENNLNSASNGGGIEIDDDSDNNTINGNTCNGNANAGAGTAYGILIANANCNENTVMGNTCLNNDTNYNDTGTNTFDTDGAAQALNNIA